MIELVDGRKYYGPHAVGIVLLINGNPCHFTGAHALQDARAAAKQHDKFLAAEIIRKAV